MRHTLIAPVILTLILLAVIGCGSSGEKLATVGDDEITLAEFNQHFPAERYNFTSYDDEYKVKRAFLDTLITTQLLIQAAYEKHIDQSDELSRVVLFNENKFLLDALYQKYIAKEIEPTEAELREFYNRLEYKYRTAHILLDNLDTANALLARIQDGESFEKLAFDYSIDTTARRNRGDLGFFLWGQMVDEFQEAALKLQPGEVSTPVKTRFGYHIIKLIDKLPNAQRGTFEDMKPFLENQLRARKQNKAIQAFLDEIKEKYPITVDTVTTNYLWHKREQMYPPMVLETLPDYDMDTEILDRDEKELVLATWDGGQITVMQYLTKVRQLPVSRRPALNDIDRLRETIFALETSDILVVEAHRLGIDNSPEYLDKIKTFKELNMADLMRNDSIPKPPPPDDAMARQYYDEHPDEFTTPEKIHVYEILLSDELQASKLKDEIKSLAAFKKKAAELTERPGKRSTSGDLDYIEETWFPEIFPVAKTTAIGAIGGPVATLGKYSIFYVIDKLEPQLKDYLGVKRDIIEKLTQQQNAEAFKQWVEERKATTSIHVYEDALKDAIDKTRYEKNDEAEDSDVG